MKQLTSAFLGNKNHPWVVLATKKAAPGGKAAHPPPGLALWVCGHTSTAGKSGKILDNQVNVFSSYFFSSDCSHCLDHFIFGSRGLLPQLHYQRVVHHWPYEP